MSREADLLAADNFATPLGIRLVTAQVERVELTSGDRHLSSFTGTTLDA
jgi:hypothetical protein